MVYQLWKWWFTMVNTTILPTISTSKSVCPARWRNAGLVGRALWPQSVFRDGSSKNGGAMGISWGYHGNILQQLIVVPYVWTLCIR